MSQRRHNLSFSRDRVMGLLTLVMASALVTYAAAAATLPGPGARSAAAKMLTNQSPVTGNGVRAADEPSSRRSGVVSDNAVLASATIAPVKEAAELLKPVGQVAKAPVARRMSTVGRTRTILMEVTGYCPCKECCGPDAHGVTAWGKRVSFNNGKFVAADTSVLPFGTKLIIPGYNRGRAVPVADRGGAIEGNRLDLFFPTHAQARQWGRQWVTVTVVE